MRLTELGNRRGWRVEERIVKGDWGFPGGSVGKESMCNAGDCLQHRRPGFIPWVQKIPWRRKWQPMLVFSPGESHGQRSLAGYSLWGRKSPSETQLSD